MLKDFTFEIWVPNFRWIAAHLMQRNTPSYSRTSVSLVKGDRPNRMGIVSMGRMRGKSRAYTPRGPCCELLSVFGPRSERREREHNRTYLGSAPGSRRTSCSPVRTGPDREGPFRYAPAGACSGHRPWLDRVLCATVDVGGSVCRRGAVWWFGGFVGNKFGLDKARVVKIGRQIEGFSSGQPGAGGGR